MMWCVQGAMCAKKKKKKIDGVASDEHIFIYSAHSCCFVLYDSLM